MARLSAAVALFVCSYALLDFPVVLTANQQKRPITVTDCVRTRRILMAEVHLSPAGDRVGYVVKSPDTIRNANIYQVFVRKLEEPGRSNGRLLFSGEKVSSLKWLSDSKSVMFLTSYSRSGSRILRVNVDTGETQVVAASLSSINDFTADATGELVVFSTGAEATEVEADHVKQTRGYAITFGHPKGHSLAGLPLINRSVLLVSRKGRNSRRTVSRIIIRGHNYIGNVPLLYLGNLSLSPNGRFLVFHCQPDQEPPEWSENPIVKGFQALGSKAPVLGLYEMRTGNLRLAINAPDPHERIMWAADGLAFAVNSVSPIGSVWDEPSSSKGQSFKMEAGKTHLFTVDPLSGSVTLALRNPASEDDLPLSWAHSNGDMTVRKDSRTIVRMKMQEDREWKEVSRFVSPIEHNGIQYSGMSNGKIEITTNEQPMVPPDLVQVSFTTGKSRVLTNLNAEYQKIELGKVEGIEWQNKYGARCTGLLIKPVGYVAGNIYPLVIMAKTWDESFLADTLYRTAFPPQVLANDGFVVLLANPPSVKEEPNEFPGQMGEAFNWMEMIRGAIGFLAEQKLIDRNRVGVIGFSRTSWLVDFMLTHSGFKFAAASSADSGAYNYSSYWLGNDLQAIQSSETQYGGSPYGDSLRNWLEYAPAFNAKNVQTPLLMEYVGQDLVSEPINAYEFFVALKRQGKLVELYFYPKGEHELDTPSERIASLQRNVDWFRFWIQGYEGPAPSYDPDQYVRWRHLKDQQKTENGIHSEN